MIEDMFEKTAALFCKYGVKSVSMDDIARELGISKKTIYQHVKDKEVLIEKSLSYVRSKHLEKISAVRKMGLNAIGEELEIHRMVREAVSTMNPVVDFEMRKYYPNLHRKLDENHRIKARSLMHDTIEKGIKEGFFRDNFNIDLITLIHYQRIMQLVEIKEDELPVSWLETIDQVIEYHLRAISTRKGLEELDKHFTHTNNTTHTNHEQE